MTEAADKTFTPGPEIEGEPYWAIMNLDPEGRTTANIWTHSGRITLFQTRALAERLFQALTAKDPDHNYGVRGVTSPHLEAIKTVAARTEVGLQLVTRIDDGGTVEARLLDDAEDAG